MTKKEIVQNINATLREAEIAIDHILANAEQKINAICVQEQYRYHEGLPKHAAGNIIDEFRNEDGCAGRICPEMLWNEEIEARKLRTLKNRFLKH